VDSYERVANAETQLVEALTTRCVEDPRAGNLPQRFINFYLFTGE
jgi:hypothetical protein